MQTKLSVSELNQQLKNTLQNQFYSVWVEGELSNVSIPASGHCYFTVKDSGAQMKGVLWRSSLARMSYKPKNGDKIELKGEISLYVPRGDLQIVASSMNVAGAGDLQQQFLLLKKKLQDEGLFSAEHKQTLPSSIQKVALITSESGAAIHDLITVFKRRAPHIELLLYPVAVQGEAAANQIINALASANRHQWADAVIVGRGGGSLEDLWCFNDEQLARAIFNSALPVISAVGHESDTALSDWVADMRAATPSAAAELLSSDSLQLQQSFKRYSQRLQQAITWKIKEKQQQLDILNQKNSVFIKQIIGKKRQILQSLHLKHPGESLKMVQQQLTYLKNRLIRQINWQLSQKNTKLQQNMLRLNDISPLNVLQRGYSLTLDQDKNVLKDAKNLEVGQKVTVRLKEGSFDSKIMKIYDENDMI